MQLFKKKAYTLYYADECFNCIEHDVLIGTQIWTGCNLNVTTYRDGGEIFEVNDPTGWANLTVGAWCHVDGNPANDAIYGKLYNWYAISDPRGLGPIGYHVPTVVERDTLITYLGGSSVAGGKMKEVGICHWLSPNVGATNESGFTAFGAGVRDYDGSYRDFNYIGWFWTSTGFNTTLANAFGASSAFDDLMAVGGLHDKKMGYSVRLIQDEIIEPLTCSTYSVPPGLGTLEVEGYIGYNIVEYLDCAGDPQTISVSAYQSAQEICASAIIGTNSGGAVLVSEGTCTEPVLFDLTQICAGLEVDITIENVRGGAGGYQVSTNTFTTEALALANTSWEPVSTATYTVTESPTEYWISVKDVNGNIGTNFIFAVDCVTPALCTCYTITNIGYPYLPGEGPALVGTNFSYINCEGIPSFDTVVMVGNNLTICARTGSVEIGIGDPGVIDLSITDCCVTPPSPLNFSLSQTCNGSNITLIANNITGGTGPYQFSTTTFLDATSALDNTIWAIASTSKNYFLGDNPGTYWVSVKDSLGLIMIQEIYVSCLARVEVFVGNDAFASMNDACGNSTQSLWLAPQVENTMNLGDVLFTTQTGNIRYDGAVSETSIFRYRKFMGISLWTTAECFPPECTTCSQVIAVDSQGVIFEKGCCS